MKQEQQTTTQDLEKRVDQLLKRERLFDETEYFRHTGHFAWDCSLNRYETWSSSFSDILDLPRISDIELADSLDLITEQIHPDDRLRFRGLMTSARDFASIQLDFRILNADGEHRFLRQTGIKNLDSKTGGTQILGVLIDVTAQMIEESDSSFHDSLALQAERVAEIGNFLYDDIDDIYLYVSPGCARIHGTTPAEFIAEVDSVESDLADVVESDRKWLEEAYDHFFKSGEDCSVEYRIVRPDGEIRWIRELLVAHMIKSDGLVALSRGVVQDITSEKIMQQELIETNQNLEQLVEIRTQELEQTIALLEHEIKEREDLTRELEFLANHDPLTGLPSLRLCKDRLERSLAESRREEQLTAVLFVDLDGFKAVNDDYGHEYGDALVRVVATRIETEIREIDTVARIGGDEFLIILTRMPERSIVEGIARNIVRQLSLPIELDDNQLKVGASIGIAIYPEDSDDGGELIRLADEAMYRVKDSGKNSYDFFNP